MSNTFAHMDPGRTPAPAQPLTDAELRHFRQRLTDLRVSLLAATTDHAATDRECGDDADAARTAGEQVAQLRDAARRRAVLREIAAALRRIDDGEYGYCEETGEPIGAERLEVNPTARLSLNAQERLERRQAGYARE